MELKKFVDSPRIFDLRQYWAKASSAWIKQVMHPNDYCVNWDEFFWMISHFLSKFDYGDESLGEKTAKNKSAISRTCIHSTYYCGHYLLFK